MWIWMMTGCTEATNQIKQQDSASILDTAIKQDTEDTTTNSEDTGTLSSTDCPPNMVLINDNFCIDQYEASLEEFNNGTWVAHSAFHTPSGSNFRAVSKANVKPQAHISGALAQQACEQSDKRLCTSDEWLLACQGSESRQYPYGNNYQNGACNDVYADGHPLINYFGTSEGIWDSAHMNDPNINQQPKSLAPTSTYADCVTAEVVFDLHGNIHE